jgi:signal peptidase I
LAGGVPVRGDGKRYEKALGLANKSSGIGETVSVIVQALLIAVVIRTVLFQPFNIPSGSLIPTLLIGDYLFVSKYSYGYSKNSLPFSPNLFQGRILSSNPKRGDIAVFKLPSDGQTDYIKRVVGLPGDKIQMIRGRLYINGKMLNRESVAQGYTTKDAFGRTRNVATYMETNPEGMTYKIIEIDGDNGFNDNTEVFTVPPDNFFMMGDNRDNSTDSRVSPANGGVGPVPLQNFVGRAEIIFFSVKEGVAGWQFWRWPWTVRWSRIFQRVK